LRSLESAAVDRVSNGEPEWRREARRTALTRYEALAMPRESEEVWRYVDLDFDIADFGLADEPGPAPTSEVPAADDAPRVSVVDGVAKTGAVEADRLWVGPLATAIDVRGDAVAKAAAAGIPSDLDKFAAAHAAFGGDGAFVHVAKGGVSAPVLVHVHAATPGSVSFPRVVILAEETAEASVVIDMTSPEGADLLVVPQVEVLAGPGASVKISTIQRFGRATRSIAHARGVVGRDASLAFAEAGLGGALSRLHLTVDLEGRGSSTNVIGAYFGDRDQVLDYRYFMHHAGENTNSNMFLKGAVEDEALSVFTGMIRIDESAQRTDAFQTNRNLILSEGAAAQSVPNLEILANDVRCGHGSTVGPLDEEQRYYLMSRGLDRERADRLQVRGFFEEALERFPHRDAAGPVRDWINAKFIEAQEEGRL
jgi:Fe-S cluster assembly protein SufD